MHIINTLFTLCVHFLEWLGRTTGYTYVEISVIFNLWIQGALLVLSAVVPVYFAAKNLITGTEKGSWLVLLGTVLLLLLYIIGFAWMLNHYGMDMQKAFDLCVEDLIGLAKSWHTTYNMVNIIIFVVGWLLAVGTNLLIAWKIR